MLIISQSDLDLVLIKSQFMVWEAIRFNLLPNSGREKDVYQHGRQSEVARPEI